MKIYNAFIMPYKSNNEEKIKFVSIGTAGWEHYNINTPNYAYILGLLVDTRWLITNYSRHSDLEIEKLASLIERSLYSTRNMI